MESCTSHCDAVRRSPRDKLCAREVIGSAAAGERVERENRGRAFGAACLDRHVFWQGPVCLSGVGAKDRLTRSPDTRESGSGRARFSPTPPYSTLLHPTPPSASLRPARTRSWPWPARLCRGQDRAGTTCRCCRARRSACRSCHTPRARPGIRISPRCLCQA